MLLAIPLLLPPLIGVKGIAPANALGFPGFVYIMTNDPAGNHVLAYARGADGSLTPQGSFATNGLGTGRGLGNQGGLVLSLGGQFLLAVNAGNDKITVFSVTPTGLTFTDIADSGGIMPISIAVNGNLVYVLDTSNIAGFHLSDTGKLSPIPGSAKSLSGTGPAQISFDPTGAVLVVTEKTTSTIDTFTVDSQGVASGPFQTKSSGTTPFGFAFTNSGHLIVSEAAGTATSNGSTLSSYAVSLSGGLTTISASIPDSQLAACWVVVTNNGRFAYTTNTHSGTISSYTITGTGTLSILNPTAISGLGGPLDMALSQNSRFLYVFNSMDHTIQGFTIDQNGNLASLTTVTGIPTGADGLAAL